MIVLIKQIVNEQLLKILSNIEGKLNHGTIWDVFKDYSYDTRFLVYFTPRKDAEGTDNNSSLL